MTLEHGPGHRRGLNASWPQVGVPIGLLLSNGVLALMGFLTSDATFRSVGLARPVPAERSARHRGLWHPPNTQREPHVHPRSSTRARPSRPSSRCCGSYRRQVLLAIGARVGVDVAFYTFVLFIATYVATYLGLPEQYALNAVLVAAGVQVVAIPGSATSPTASAGARSTWPERVAAAVWVFVFFRAPRHRQLRAHPRSPQSWHSSRTRRCTARRPPSSASCSRRVRYTGASMGYQLAGIVGGGIAPIVATALLAHFDSAYAVATYVAAMLAVTVVCVLLAPETARDDLHGDTRDSRHTRDTHGEQPSEATVRSAR